MSVYVVDTLTNPRLTVELNTNKSCKLSVRDVQKAEKVTWTIDQAVATINDYGKVTAVGQGLTIATAIDDNGSVIGQIYIRVI